MHTFIKIGAFLTIGAIIAGTIWAPSRPRRVKQTVVLVADGSRIASLFVGAPKNRAFDYRLVGTRPPTVIPCPGPKEPGLGPAISRILEPTVYAQGSCSNTPCGGQQYVDNPLTCTASGCTGNFQNAAYDPLNGSYTKGVHADGTSGCQAAPGGTCTQGICNQVTCDVGPSCPAGVDPCNGVADCGPPGLEGVGYSCINNCCIVNITCAGYGQTCGNGVNCCSPWYCQNNQCFQFGGQGSPIVLDAFDEGFRLTSLGNGVRFRVQPGGPLQQMSWTDSNWRNGWLALDRNGDGTIDDFTELFGNFTPQPPSPNPNGFLALAVFDEPANGGNGNGFIDPGDAVYSHLRVWIDANHNGFSEPNELHTLQELGIFKIGLDYHKSPFVDRYGNQFRYKGSVWDNGGKERDICYDVFLLIQSN